MSFKLKILVLLSFFVFSQMTHKDEVIYGEYVYEVKLEFIRHFKQTINILKKKKLEVETIYGGNKKNTQGKWKIEEDNIIIFYKYKHKDKVSDTLKINKEKGIITSIGRYKKQNKN